jgi:hypothetical protein
MEGPGTTHAPADPTRDEGGAALAAARAFLSSSHALREAEALDGPATVSQAAEWNADSWKRSLVTEETAVTKPNTTPDPKPQPQKVELLDCGQASKMTKGYPLFLLFEMSSPPFDRLVLF